MSAAIMMPSQPPHRKPIPGRNGPQQAPPSSRSIEKRLANPSDPRAYHHGPPRNPPPSVAAPPIPTMSSSRVSSAHSMQSSTPPQQFQSYQTHSQPFPQYQQPLQQQFSQPAPQQAPPPSQPPVPQSYNHQQYATIHSRRTLSNATTSSTASLSLQRASTGTSYASSANAPRRSTSSRSNSSVVSPTSYVALMRKQKATVWCDRAQHQDPRFLAAQRAQRMRAMKEVAGSRTSTSSASYGTMTSGGMAGSGSSGLRSKIRHHGAMKANTYIGGANLSGAGVPMRLSASEVDDAHDSDDEVDSKYMNYHSRLGTMNGAVANGAAMSLSSRSRTSGPPGRLDLQQKSMRSLTNGSTRSTGQSPEDVAHDDDDDPSKAAGYEDETPVPGHYDDRVPDYFASRGGHGRGGGSGGAEGESGGSSEEEERFGALGGLNGPAAKTWTDQDRKTSEELRRRGSVDDRAMTMSGVRLFVANPDLSD